jgi:hypothetical protein
MKARVERSGLTSSSSDPPPRPLCNLSAVRLNLRAQFLVLFDRPARIEAPRSLLVWAQLGAVKVRSESLSEPALAV